MRRPTDANAAGGAITLGAITGNNYDLTLNGGTGGNVQVRAVVQTKTVDSTTVSNVVSDTVVFAATASQTKRFSFSPVSSAVPMTFAANDTLALMFKRDASTAPTSMYATITYVLST